LQVQNNSIIERIYINKKENELNKIDDSIFSFYKPGDILVIYIGFEKDKINYKRRRNFTDVGYFINYDDGNVRCMPIRRYKTNASEIVLRIYYIILDLFVIKMNINNNDLNSFIEN
jgi:hypothetical protein